MLKLSILRKKGGGAGVKANAFPRAVVESLVDRSIRKIAEDPERGLRNLVDIGAVMATGRFQKQYMGLVQGMLRDENCPYYELVCRLVRETSRRSLTTFGVNVGWQSWTVGARRIRSLEAARGVDIPWFLTLRMEGGGAAADWAELVRRGQEAGVYTYFVHTNGDRAALEAAARLAEGAPLCAFLLFSSPGAVSRAMGQLGALDNVMTLVDAGGEGWQEAAGQLREERRLCGFWRLCAADGDVEQAESWLEELRHEEEPVVFLLAGPGCTAAGRSRLCEFTRDAWERQRYPMLVFDYYSDILLVDKIISGSACFAGVLPDGRPTVCRDGRELAAEAGEALFVRALLGRPAAREKIS